jgi:putative Holliday junction resolvase
MGILLFDVAGLYASGPPVATAPRATLRRMRVLGIDYGQRRIGLALSDATGSLARPWKTLARQGSPGRVADALAAEVLRLRAEDDGLDAVVLGLPRRLNGSPTDQTAEVEKLAASLRNRIPLPVILQDERLSSREAESLLARRIKDWRKRKPLLDAASAAVILQDYLDTRAQPQGWAQEDDPA